MANTKGIDVSEHNNVFNWATVKKSGIQFAVVRAGFGNTATQQDKKFVEHMNGALNAGMDVGVYWFSYARSVDEAKKEAEVCLDVIKAYKNRITLPVFFDFEYKSEEYAEKAGVTVDRRYVTDVTRAFCETVRNAGYIAGYYTNQDYYKNKLYPEELADYDLWLADYTGGPEYICAIQQYTSTGRVNGIDDNVDMNVCFKSYSTSKPVTPAGIAVGSTVKIKAGAVYSNGVKVPDSVAGKEYTVQQLNSSKALLREIVSWVDTKYLTLVSGDTEKPADVAVNVTYRVRAGGKWYPAVKNLDDYAGKIGVAITDVAIKASTGKVKYRVHIKGGAWLPYVTGYDTGDAENGYAGDNKPIDAIEVCYYGDTGATTYKRAVYRVSPVGESYYPWQHDDEKSAGQDGYAGNYGRTIDRFQIVIE